MGTSGRTAPLHVQLLSQELARRAQKNKRYSLRAFAGHLGLHPSALSRVLSGKQKLSKTAAVDVAKKLALSKESSRLFLQSVLTEQKVETAAELGQAISVPELKVHPKKIDEETYAQIAKVTCLALRELMLTQGFHSDPEWIASRLGLESDEIEPCLAALVKAGLAEKVNGEYSHVDRHLTAVDSKATSATRRSLQREILQRALGSLDKDPFERRGHYGMTMAVDASRVAKANKMILDFMEELCDYLEGGERNEVYQLSVQLFPLTNAVDE